MKREIDKDIFGALKEVAEDINLSSRNYNDELIGVEYYINLHTLSQDQILELSQLWNKKCQTCHKEKIASQWMIVQIFILISIALYIAAISGGVMVATLAGIFGIIAMIAMIEDKRVGVAKRNLQDARNVYQHLRHQKH